MHFARKVQEVTFPTGSKVYSPSAISDRAGPPPSQPARRGQAAAPRHAAASLPQPRPESGVPVPPSPGPDGSAVPKAGPSRSGRPGPAQPGGRAGARAAAAEPGGAPGGGAVASCCRTHRGEAAARRGGTCPGARPAAEPGRAAVTEEPEAPAQPNTVFISPGAAPRQPARPTHHPSHQTRTGRCAAAPPAAGPPPPPAAPLRSMAALSPAAPPARPQPSERGRRRRRPPRPAPAPAAILGRVPARPQLLFLRRAPLAQPRPSQPPGRAGGGSGSSSSSSSSRGGSAPGGGGGGGSAPCGGATGFRECVPSSPGRSGSASAKMGSRALRRQGERGGGAAGRPRGRVAPGTRPPGRAPVRSPVVAWDLQPQLGHQQPQDVVAAAVQLQGSQVVLRGPLQERDQTRGCRRLPAGRRGSLPRGPARRTPAAIEPKPFQPSAKGAHLQVHDIQLWTTSGRLAHAPKARVFFQNLPQNRDFQYSQRHA